MEGTQSSIDDLGRLSAEGRHSEAARLCCDLLDSGVPPQSLRTQISMILTSFSAAHAPAFRVAKEQSR